MDYTFYQGVKVIPGIGSVNKIGELCRDTGCKKAFIVCDQGIKQSGIADRIEKLLEKSAIEYYEYAKVVSDPPASVIDEGAQICRENNCDCVIAVGGGSALDSAKGINILRFNPGRILDYAAKPMQVCRGLITIPTTSGTGSELSNGAIISDTEHNLKLPILCANCMSEYTILDPELTRGMPASLTMMTGLDVFSHAFEAYTAITANMMTDLVCEKIMETVIEYLPQVIKDGNNLAAREKMQAASSMGGWMLYNCCAHVGHSIAHVLGAHFHLAHGACCSYGLSNVIVEMADTQCEKIKKTGRLFGLTFDDDISSIEIASMVANKYKEFASELGLKPVEDCQLQTDTLDELVNEVVNEPFAGLAPFKVTHDVAERLLRSTLKL
ncbi:iron-containing alcohol dehydrogenase [Muricomes sp. OA1]|uniref:Iron-containing alcohol dehydrogenase n=1 Tax=Hungatella hathewayi TaxID=154046 RepID=A0A3E2X257_9FIRM|nr:MULTISPECIES: iron-containing alcohol dehydrogenase [Clostridia]MCH1971735.1 iron-containing alcohol dehydrogenase [Muricomes sp. OA1]RGC35486.1 iron-containing alcohol dehydrogenase [Hungatella hathewayi]GKH35008.1 alcohol dehydrogenase [Faecalicatena contorta]